MKLFIILLVLLTFLIPSQGCAPASSENEHLIYFMRGLLNEINEHKEVKDLIRCLAGASDILAMIKKAFEHIDKRDKYSMRIGFQYLFESMIRLLSTLIPCSREFKRLKQLSEALQRADVEKIIQKITRDPREIFDNIRNGLKCFSSCNYECIGKSTGYVLRVIFLNELEAKEFLKGMAEGIKETGNIDKLINCINEVSDVINDIVDGVLLIRQMNLESFIKGIVYLIRATRILGVVIKPCSQGFSQLQKLFEAIKTAEPTKIAQIILKNPLTFIFHITDFIYAFKAKEIQRAGKDIGKVLFLLFFTRTQRNSLM